MATDSPDLSQRRNRKPKPPADYGTDSAEVTPPKGTEPATKPARKEPVIQLNTRVALSYRELIDEVAEREGLSIRAVIEKALETTYRKR